jgi:cyclic beta-1,2-glucan synthetase
MGNGAAAVRLLQMVNPVERTQDFPSLDVYRGEPYAVAADVSASPLRTGASGWTWYTGSAGWMYRVWIEDVVGFRLRGNQLFLRPEFPEDWSSCKLTFRFHSSLYRIEMDRVSQGNTCRIEVDGKFARQGFVPLVDDGGEHHIQVEIGVLDDRADTRTQPKVGSAS